jgi:hypothetical protein
MHTVLRLRSVISAALTALVVTLSIAVPLLDRADAGSDPVVESEHHPATCPPSHDHTVCAQFSANLPLASARARHPAAATVRVALPAGADRTSHSAASVESNRSRAPPFA